MGFFSFFGSGTDELTTNEIPAIFPLSLQSNVFIKSDILNTYIKILTDTMERTHGVPEEKEPALWDNCLVSEASRGLISLLAEAMSEMSDLFLVYKPSTKVIRKADTKEQQQIEADYKASGSSKVGVFISFKNYHRTDMLKIYSSFEYCVLSSLNKSLNVAKAIQFKIHDLRASVSMIDAPIAAAQAKSISSALGKGNDAYMDAKDVIETAKIDTEPTEKAITFLDAKRAFILGLPLSYINGEQTGGLNASGEGDMRAVEQGLKQYYVSILRPVIKAILDAETTFKSQDFKQLQSAGELLKTFDLTSEENLSGETKQELTALAFNLDAAEEKKRIEAGLKEAEKKALKDAENGLNQPDPNQDPKNPNPNPNPPNQNGKPNNANFKKRF